MLKTARSIDRAVLLWLGGCIAASSLALLEYERSETIVAAIALVLCPAGARFSQRTTSLLLAAMAAYGGPPWLLVAAPLAICSAGLPDVAIRSALSLAVAFFAAHHLQSLPALELIHLPILSTGFIVVPGLCVLLTLGRLSSPGAVLKILLGIAVVVGVIDLAAGIWINAATLTAPYFRISAAILGSTGGLFFARRWQVERCTPNRRVFLGTLAVGAMAVAFVPSMPIETVVFDEAHGSWETISASYGPSDFGRGVNYTYALLARYAGKLAYTTRTINTEEDDLPSSNSIVVIKMPTIAFSSSFAQRLTQWVTKGGRLLIVADHTDLYDNAQNLNELLTPNFGVKFNSDATFDRTGRPNMPWRPLAFAALGQLDAIGRNFPWQTGTTLSQIPINALQLATFGASFAEPGDYSRPNRFGPFQPSVYIPFASRTSLAAFGYGGGAVALLLDSTPWSSFSIFREEYRELFRRTLDALSRPKLLSIVGWTVIALIGSFITMIFWEHALTLGISGLLLGVLLSGEFQVGSSAFQASKDGRDYETRVLIGEQASIEFLKALIPPGERNYSRIVSSLAKFQLDAGALPPGMGRPDFQDARRWLLIEPDGAQLPTASETLQHLRAGRDITVLFAPDQLKQSFVRQWLSDLNLNAQPAVGLAIAEDTAQGQTPLLARRGAALFREIRVMARALSNSQLNERQVDQFFQSFTARPTKLPRESGLLNISFAADQFSDEAVGDVWEGIHPSALGRLREQQLAAVIRGDDFVDPFPADVMIPNSEARSYEKELVNFVVLEDGKLSLSGTIESSDVEVQQLRPIASNEDAIAYLRDLRDRAVHFVRHGCPRHEEITQCRDRMIGPDLIEWMVSWAVDDDGRIRAIELLHERSFSGLGRTVNVVFAR